MPIPNSPLVVSAILSSFGDHAEKWGTPRPTPLWEVSSTAIVTNRAVAVSFGPVERALDN